MAPKWTPKCYKIISFLVKCAWWYTNSHHGQLVFWMNTLVDGNMPSDGTVLIINLEMYFPGVYLAIRDFVCFCWPDDVTENDWRNHAAPRGNSCVNSSLPGQNGCHFADYILEWIVINGNFCISIQISLKFLWVQISNKSALVQVMVWHRTDDKPLSEPMLTQFTDAYMPH